jgi:hypothetical protein
MAGEEEGTDGVACSAMGAGQVEGRILLNDGWAFIEPIFWKS